MEFRHTTLSRGLSLSNRPGGGLKVYGHGGPVSTLHVAGIRRQLQGKLCGLIATCSTALLAVSRLKKGLEKIPLSPLNSLSLA